MARKKKTEAEKRQAYLERQKRYNDSPKGKQRRARYETKTGRPAFRGSGYSRKRYE